MKTALPQVVQKEFGLGDSFFEEDEQKYLGVINGKSKLGELALFFGYVLWLGVRTKYSVNFSDNYNCHMLCFLVDLYRFLFDSYSKNILDQM